MPSLGFLIGRIVQHVYLNVTRQTPSKQCAKMAKALLSLSFLWYAAAVSAAQDSFDQPDHMRLNFSSASPHVFASAFGLLQQWSNTFCPFGHSIVPCEIPINTNLYHARIDGDLPPSPEWFAFDAAMSYSIAGTLDTSHLLTYRTTKKVKCIYFDGTSAALNGDGNMDSQMVFIHNNSANVPKNPTFGPGKPNNRTSGDPNGPMLGAEYDRAEGLCAYIRENNLGGRGWGYEGIVRMNAGFELIWCDFESPSARLVSRINSGGHEFLDNDNSDDWAASLRDGDSRQFTGQKALQEPLIEDNERVRKPSPRRRRYMGSDVGWLTASANQYGFVGGMPGRGEVRVKLDSCGIWSFYDSGLVDQETARVTEERKTLNITSNGDWKSPADEDDREDGLQLLQRRRRSHRADHISKRDGLYMQDSIEQRLRMALDPMTNNCSGIDWHQTAEEIVLDYSTNLQGLVGLLKDLPNEFEKNRTETLAWLIPVRELGHLMMAPYYEYPSKSEIKASAGKAFRRDAPAAQDAYERCRDQHLPFGSESLASSEKPFFSATTDVLGAICQVVLSTFLSFEAVYYTAFDTPSSTLASLEIRQTAIKRRHDVEELMAWLGWADQWTACNPGCGPSELCWIPMWPISFMTRPSRKEEVQEGPDDRSPPRGRRPPPHGGPYHGGPYGGPYGGPHHGGPYGGPHYGPPPGFGWGDDDGFLWEPVCVNRTQMLAGMY